MPLNTCVAALPYFTSTLHSTRKSSTEHRAVLQDAIKWPVITRARPNRYMPLAFFAHSSLLDITYYKRQGYRKITAQNNVMKLSVTSFFSNTYIFDHCTVIYFGRKKRSPQVRQLFFACVKKCIIQQQILLCDSIFPSCRARIMPTVSWYRSAVFVTVVHFLKEYKIVIQKDKVRTKEY